MPASAPAAAKYKALEPPVENCPELIQIESIVVSCCSCTAKCQVRQAPPRPQSSASFMTICTNLWHWLLPKDFEAHQLYHRSTLHRFAWRKNVHSNKPNEQKLRGFAFGNHLLPFSHSCSHKATQTITRQSVVRLPGGCRRHRKVTVSRPESLKT